MTGERPRDHPLKVYVACSSKELPFARGIIAAVRMHGHEITHDWTEVIEKEPGMTPSQLSRCARDDVDGVVSADVLLVIITKNMRSIGAMIELGAAISHGKLAVVVEHEARFDHMFSNHERITKVSNVDSALFMLDLLSRNAREALRPEEAQVSCSLAREVQDAD